MSINSLNGDEAFKHTFEDDMESCFYVVLYAGLRWLPHIFTGDLAKTMTIFFDDCQEEFGMVVGGAWKQKNVTDRYLLKRVEWKNKHLAKWINDALSLQRRQINNEGTPIWTAEALSDLWKSADKNIQYTNDRFEHLILVNDEPVKDTPVPATVFARLPSPQAPPPIRSAKTSPAETRDISRRKRPINQTEHEQPKRPRRLNVRY